MNNRTFFEQGNVEPSKNRNFQSQECTYCVRGWCEEHRTKRHCTCKEKESPDGKPGKRGKRGKPGPPGEGILGYVNLVNSGGSQTVTSQGTVTFNQILYIGPYFSATTPIDTVTIVSGGLFYATYSVTVQYVAGNNYIFALYSGSNEIPGSRFGISSTITGDANWQINGNVMFTAANGDDIQLKSISSNSITTTGSIDTINIVNVSLIILKIS